MAIPSTIESLSTTAASNGPSGSDQRTLADDGLRQAYAFIKQLVVQGSDIASAGTITPPSTASLFDITGTTTITTIASTNSWDGRVIYLQFDGALTLTHNGTTLILPGAANITTVAGDIAVFVQRGSGAWQCVNYLRKDGSSPGVGSFTTLSATGNLTVNGNTTLGDAGTDTVTTNGNVTMNAPSSGNHTISGTLVPGTDATYALGSTTARWTSINASALVDGTNGTLVSSSGTQSRFGAGSVWTSSAWYANNSAYINLTSDGRLYGTALHNNAGAVTGTTNQYIASGTYTPTLTNATNVSSSSANAFQWIRVGNVVTVSGGVVITPTASTTLTTLGVSLPIASNLASAGQLAGAGLAGTAAVGITENTGSDRADVTFTSPSSGSGLTTPITFTYVVV